jgi:hypothetical protein
MNITVSRFFSPFAANITTLVASFPRLRDITIFSNYNGGNNVYLLDTFGANVESLHFLHSRINIVVRLDENGTEGTAGLPNNLRTIELNGCQVHISIIRYITRHYYNLEQVAANYITILLDRDHQIHELHGLLDPFPGLRTANFMINTIGSRVRTRYRHHML